VTGTQQFIDRLIASRCSGWAVQFGTQLELDPDYAQGASDGWEGVPLVEDDSSRYLAGYADGQAALLAVRTARPGAFLKLPENMRCASS